MLEINSIYLNLDNFQKIIIYPMLLYIGIIILKIFLKATFIMAYCVIDIGIVLPIVKFIKKFTIIRYKFIIFLELILNLLESFNKKIKYKGIWNFFIKLIISIIIICFVLYLPDFYNINSEKKLYLNSNGVDGSIIREEPTINSNVITEISGSNGMEYLDEIETESFENKIWFQVRLNDGTVGWISERLVEER